MVLGDADCISNEGMTPPIRRYGASNFTLIPGMFHWLPYGNVPVDVKPPCAYRQPDTHEEERRKNSKNHPDVDMARHHTAGRHYPAHQAPEKIKATL